MAAALRGAVEAGAETQLIDLRDYKLTLSTRVDTDPTYPDSLAALRELVRSADGIVLGTPEYHGSFSGVLKNALDLMGFEEFEGKMIGLVGVSGGRWAHSTRSTVCATSGERCTPGSFRNRHRFQRLGKCSIRTVPFAIHDWKRD